MFERDSSNIMKTFLFLFVLIPSFLMAQKPRQVSGYVTDGKSALPNVNIKVVDTNKGTKTDNVGYYLLMTEVGDIVEYTHMGHSSIRVVIEDVTKVLNLEMPKISAELDEVIVKKQVRKSQKELGLEYYRNKNIVRTKFGYIDRDKASYTIRTYSGDDLPKGGLTLMQALRMLYPQLRTSIGPDDLASVFIRPNSSLTNSRGVIFDLDGHTLLEPPNLGIEEIDRIAIIPSASYSVRYGSVAAEGVIVINTKTGKIKPKTDAIEVKDLEAAQAEFIDSNFCKPSLEVPQSNQLKKLFAAESETKAVEIFDKEKTLFKNSPYELIDAGNYFSAHWKNEEKALEIWNGVKIKFSENSNVLKVIAYYLERQGNLKDALNVYQKISALRPNYAQTYRDLANMHRQLDNSEQALNLYIKYLKYQKGNVLEGDSEGINFVVNVEALNILSREKLKKTKELKNFEFPFKNSATRILLEWNNGEAEFDVQMILQDKSSLIWKHSYIANPEQIHQEKKLGYSTKQFFIDKEDKGKWVFNMKYLGNKSTDPSYLKATVQYNYGTVSEKEEVHVIRLPNEESCLHLFSI